MMASSPTPQRSGVLAVDLGKTKTAAAHFGPDGRTSLPTVAGAPGLAAPGGPAAALRAIDGVIAGLGATSPAATRGTASALAVGAAGALAAAGAAADLAGLLLARPGVTSVMVTSDAITAHAGAFGGRPGVVLVAGTGAVAVAIDDRGDVRPIDGEGPECGDRGSGGWIGRQAIAAAVSGRGGRGLMAAVEAVLGTGWQAAGDAAPAPAERARLVPVLAKLWLAGDPQATDLFERAATELARTVLAADVAPAVLVGGLTGLGAPFRALLESKTPGLAWVRPAGDPLDGAALLADRTDLPHEPLIQRTTHPSAAVDRQI